MIYITIKLAQRQQNFDLANFIRYGTILPTDTRLYGKTQTFATELDSSNYQRLLQKYKPAETQSLPLKALEVATKDLLVDDMQIHYDTFHIPKRSGGLRQIDAPKPQLKTPLSILKDQIQNEMYVLGHNAAHAYTTQRSIVTAMQVHQRNNSKWFLKLDLKDFFGSHNLEYIINAGLKVYPFSELLRNDLTKNSFINLLKLGLLNDKLPQGTPLSPILTNTLMAPIDYDIQKGLINHQKQSFIYTRYADDLLISSKFHFDWRETQDLVKQILIKHETPFQIKQEKTRYGSTAGRNWNLGIMLNKDNNLTIGHKQNQRFRAMIFNFLQDLTNGNTWSKIDVQVMLGQISYYKSIEPEYVKHVLDKYSRKFNKNTMNEIKNILKM